MILPVISRLLNSALRPFDVAVIRRRTLLERFQEYDDKYSNPWFVKGQLPNGAAEYLRYDNPRLTEYKRRYKGHPASQHSVWQPEQLVKKMTLQYFRGDNQYIWQTRRVKRDLLISYAVSTYYVKRIDALGLLDRLDEDGLFGAITYNIDHERTVSRDLLDSILEISFLQRQLNLSEMPSVRVLDIGAGYGRLAYRLAKALPNLEMVFCADAVPESTFLCEYYLRYRGVTDKAEAIPLDRIDEVLATNRIDIVTNIHSFPECPMESISWWLDLIWRYKIKHFMLVVQNGVLLSTEADGTRRDFRPLLEMRGFELVAKELIYAPGMVASTYGLYPD